MACSSCRHANRDGAAFCASCGARLAPCCAACGVELRVGASFCDSCGARVASAGGSDRLGAHVPHNPPPHLIRRILRDRGGLQGERRTVTVLFADAVDSTALGERLDEERLYELMQGAVKVMSDAVHRFEGTVTQFRGDGIMAVFGAPIAHEDAARRAVAAALEMQRALARYGERSTPAGHLDLRFRVGLNTGPVVVGSISDDLRMDFTAIGDTVNLAARMEAAATPGQVLVSEGTYRAARDYFEWQEVESMVVKGKSETVLAFVPSAERAGRTRFAASRARGLTPFVGRSSELATLEQHVAHASAGDGRVVFVSGHAGIGKSRLLLELRRRVGNGARWLEGGCSALGRTTPYLPIIGLMQQAFGIQEEDDHETVVHRIDAGVSRWTPAARETGRFLKLLASVDRDADKLASVDPIVRRLGILDGLAAMVTEEACVTPIVMVLEDLHWIDEESEQAIARLVDLVPSNRLLLILTYRPGYAHRLGERSFFHRVSLSSLPPDECIRLATDSLGHGALPAELRQLIVSKGEGNPFYIEEVTRSLVESGAVEQEDGHYTLQRPADQIHVPDTIQEVILARIDRLEGEARSAIQLASVIGREFTVRLLDRIADLQTRLGGALDNLKGLELIYETARFPELAYMFKHALTHDVAYSTLLIERRRALHRAVAEAIEELYSDRLAEHYERLAEHYSAAEDWNQAFGYLDKAGDKAADACANALAMDFYARALEVGARVGGSAQPRLARLASRRGWILTNTARYGEATAEFDRMLALAEACADRHQQGLALAYRACAEWNECRFDVTEATCQRALMLAGDEWDDVRLFACGVLSMHLQAQGRTEDALPYEREAERLSQVVPDAIGQSWWAMVGWHRRNWEGRFDEAVRPVTAWRASGTHRIGTIVLSSWTLAISEAGRGRYAEALALLDQALSDAARTDNRFVEAGATNTKGWVLGELENLAAAEEWNRTGVQLAVDADYPFAEVENNARINLGDNLMATGRLDEAEAEYAAVERTVRHPRPADTRDLHRYSQHLFHSLGELWLRRGDSTRALAYAGECLAIAEPQGHRKNIVKGRRLRGEVFMALGRLDEAERDLEAALDIARAVGNPPQLWKTLAAMGALRRSQHRGDDARAAYRDALAVIDDVARNLNDESLTRTCLESAHVQEFRRAAE